VLKPSQPLARTSTARTHEIGVRLALGAGRARLLRQLLTESFALAALGGGVGLILASLASRQLIALASAGEPWQLSTAVDWRIAGFTLVVTFASVVVFGLAPAFAATRVSLNAALHTSRRSQTGESSVHTATRAFAIAQVSLSLLLVAGALLLVRSFWKLTHQEFGYRTESLLMAPLINNGGSFQEIFAPTLSLTLARRAKEVPGVRNAAVSATGLLSSRVHILPGRVSLPDRALPESIAVRIVPATPGYLETMGIPIVRGRSLTDDDGPSTPRVAVISETAAHLMFGSADPLGQKFSSGAAYVPDRAFEVVGVMRDVRYDNLREPLGGLVFAPLGQTPLSTSPTLVVRTVGDSASFAPALEQLVREVAPKIKIARIESIHDLIQTEARRERLVAWLSGGFGFVALMLAAVGLYGVISYAAGRRTQEMGIRLALGARPGQVRALLLKEVAFVLAIGLALGGAATILLARMLGSLLFGLTPQDPTTIAFAAVLLSSVAFIAAYVPARRAGRLDPMSALRTE
jgi:predicted permease